MSEPVARGRFRIHLLVGVWLGLPLLFVVSTGALATISPELDRWLVPELRCDHGRASEMAISFGALERAAREAMPGARVHALAMPVDDGTCAFALTELPERTFHHVYVDPDSGVIRGRGSYRTPRRFLRDLHRAWLLGENVGLTVVGLFSWALWAAIVTGLGSLGSLRGGGLRRVWRAGSGTRRLHRRLALVLAPFLVLVALTSSWYFVEHVLGLFDVRVSPIPPRRDVAIVARLRADEPMLDADVLVARAHAAYPELRPTFVALAVPRRTYAVVTGPSGVRFVRDQASEVFLDPFDGHALRVQRADALGLLGEWEQGVDFLHFGTFAGTPSRYGYTLLGVIVAIAIGAGTIGRLRRRRVAAKLPLRKPADSRDALRR